jgi:hypothetical protein
VREALLVVEKGRSADAVRMALEALPEADPTVREVILARYRRIEAAPRRLDADCAIRAALLRGLRSCAVPADAALLERAAATYEFSYAGEAAAKLRAAALLTLSELDGRTATFHAVRLLAEATPGSHEPPLLAPGTREPAITAARLLGVLDQPQALYAHLLRGSVEREEAAECFRGLAGAPDSVLLDLAERWRESLDEIALLGLLDVLLDTLAEHPEPEPLEAVLIEFLRESPHLDLVRYVATTAVARHRTAVIEALREGPWPVPARRAIVEEALGLLSER